MAHQSEESQVQPKRDPRLMPVQSEGLSILAFYGRLAGWAGSILLLATLGWAAIVKTVDRTPIKVLGILAIICIAFWIYTNVHQLVIAVRRRGVQTALNSALFTVLVLGILVVVNYIGTRHEVLRLDWSESKQYTLSDQTIKVIKDLDKKVTITAFISDEADRGNELRRRLNEYRIKSSKIDLVMYDTKTSMDKAQEFGVRFDPTIFMEAEGSKREEIQGGSEEQLTSTLLAVTTGQRTRICFLTGHGEASLSDMAGGMNKRSLNLLKGLLEQQQYQADELTLFNQKAPAVPSDCKLLVIAGARNEPTKAELDAIQKYMDQGGNLLLMLEPAPAPQFASLLKTYGVTPLSGVVTDPQGTLGGGMMVAKADPSHDVTAPLSLVVLPTPTAFDVESSTPPPAMPGAPPPPNDQKATPLLRTYSSAAKVSGANARTGELTLGVAVDMNPPAPPPSMPGAPPPPPQEEGRKSRLVVIGDSDFASDNTIQTVGGFAQGNISLVAIAINWLVKNEKLVSIPPKEPVDKPFTATDAQRRFIWLIVIGIVPLLIIAGGAYSWWRRRV